MLRGIVLFLLFSWVHVLCAQQDQFQEAKKIRYTDPAKSIEKSLKLLEKYHGDTMEAKVYEIMGDAYWQAGEFGKSKAHYEKALHLSEKLGFTFFVAKQHSNVGYMEMENGNYETALAHMLQSNAICTKNNYYELYEINISYVATLMSALRRYKDALRYYMELHAYCKKVNDPVCLFNSYNNIGKTYYELGDTLKALKYFNISLKQAQREKNEYNIAFMYHNLCYIELNRGHTKGMKEQLLYALDVMKKNHAETYVIFILCDLGRYYAILGQRAPAEKYLNEALAMARRNGSKNLISRICGDYAQAMEILKDYRKAFDYMKEYQSLNMELINEQMDQRLAEKQSILNLDKKNYEISLRKKENTLLKQKNELKELQLKARRNWMIFLIIGMLLLILTSVAVYNRIQSRRKVEMLNAELRQNQLNKQLQELEIMTLRAQMNPHFIFNCINSIQDCIERRELDAAESYLSKFARLLRLILETSKNPEITLSDELQLLKLYLEMEQLRFRNSFEFQFQIDDDIETELIEIPNMLLQPVLENAVKHGIPKEKAGGKIQLKMSLRNDQLLHIEITDNGRGYEQSQQNKREGHVSTGIENIRNRVLRNGEQAKFDIRENREGETVLGTTVAIELAI